MPDQITETAETQPQSPTISADLTVTPLENEVIVQASVTQVAAETEAEQKERSRNYSFLHRNPDSLDVVEIGSTKYSIPATIGSSYWAILKVFYENADKPVYIDALLDQVSKLMTDRKPEEWEEYCNKKQTTVHKKSAATCHVQPIKPWQDRIVGNAKTLTRLGGNSKYGQRLYERGHVLVFGYDKDQKPCFTLHTSLDILSQPKVRAPKTPKVKAPKAEKTHDKPKAKKKVKAPK